jgi:glycine dehydrogenase subunit 1
MIKAPGEYGVQVVCGEGQSLGNYQGFGGPLLGFLAVEKKYVRRMPGRLVGKTTDSRGNTSYTLTLQTREQHIRRERATSNICTNQGLVALRSVIFMSLTGGVFREYAVYNHKLAVKLFHLLQEKGFVPVTNGPFFNEFTMSHPEMESIYNYLKSHGIIPGKLSSDKKELTIAVTEMLTEEDIITYSRLAGEV